MMNRHLEILIIDQMCILCLETTVRKSTYFHEICQRNWWDTKELWFNLKSIIINHVSLRVHFKLLAPVSETPMTLRIHLCIFQLQIPKPPALDIPLLWHFSTLLVPSSQDASQCVYLWLWKLGGEIHENGRLAVFSVCLIIPWSKRGRNIQISHMPISIKAL